MQKLFWTLLFTLLLLAPVLAQLPPTTVPHRQPTLKRDRTLQVMLPKIIQAEDERIVTKELLDIVVPMSGYSGSVRKRAILALGRIGYPSAVSLLTDVLKTDKQEDMREMAAFALGEIESYYAVSALLDHLDPEIEKSPQVRARAVEALGKIASNKLAADSLGNYGMKGVMEALVKQLPDPSAAVSDDAKLNASLALTALIRIKQPATVPAILNQLKSPDADLRWQAANALARLREGIGAAVPSLLPLTLDKEPLVRANAARALGVAKDARAIDSLIRLLGDSDVRVHASAITALGAIADAKAVSPLLEMGNRQLGGYRAVDRDKQGIPAQQNLLLLIATALGNLKDNRALPFLKTLRIINDGRVGANPETEIAIARFGETAFFDFPDSARVAKENWRAIANFAQGLGEVKTEKARAALIDLLAAKPDARAVSDILNAMEAAHLEGLEKILLAELKEQQDVIVRATAAEILGKAGDESDIVITALLDAYKAAKADKMNDARIAILEAADKLKHPINIQALAEETQDEDYVVRRRAVELLRESKTETPPVKLMLGAVKTGHNRDYWKRMADFAMSGNNPTVIMHTKKGDVRLELFASDAPMTVDNFLQLAKSGFFNGLAFIRVVPNFVIQGGDPRGDQNGSPGYQIRDEINQRIYQTGTLGMALSGKDTGGSQFFITHSPQPHLDGGYTVFGQVIEGMEVVNRIARGDKIESVEIVEKKEAVENKQVVK